MSRMSQFDQIIQEVAVDPVERDMLRLEINELWNNPDYDTEPSTKAMVVFEIWEEDNK